MIRSALTLLLAAAASGAVARTTNVWGPPPDWERYKALGEAAVRAELLDPTRFVVEWPNGYMKSGWNHKGRVTGYLSCGLLRATVPMPGFHTLTQFAVVIDDDTVRRVDISTRESKSLVNMVCDVLVSRGMMPPATLMAAPRDTVIASLGLTVHAMPEGAYVAAVTAGSPAEHAHLAPGIVITRVNGVALAGMGPAMAAVLGADAPSLTLDTATGERLTLSR